jgi:DNA-binding NarL/FixJ family response regulator
MARTVQFQVDMVSVHIPHTELGATANPRQVGRGGTPATRVKQILEAREELVLRLRFASVRRPQSRSQVARFLGLSDRTVRCIERQALRKLRLDALGPVGAGWQGWDEV